MSLEQKAPAKTISSILINLHSDKKKPESITRWKWAVGAPKTKPIPIPSRATETPPKLTTVSKDLKMSFKKSKSSTLPRKKRHRRSSDDFNLSK